MRSATATTWELDDVPTAVAELTEQIRKKLPAARECAGVLHAQPHTDQAELSARLSAEFGCPVIGGTTAGAATLSNDGHQELATVLHMISADDCVFSAAISAPLEPDPRRGIVATWEAALTKLKEKDTAAVPVMVFCVTSTLKSLSSDNALALLSKSCGDLPVFGFSAADDFEFSAHRVFLDGESAPDRMALLLVSGNARPVFEVQNLAGSRPFSRRKVTKSHGNVIYEIDGRPAYEYIREFPFIDGRDRSLWNCQFFVEIDGAGNSGISVSRALNTCDMNTGEISCFADVPENASITLMFCDEADVTASAEAALRGIREKVESAEKASSDKSGYRYSTVFIASCSLRNLFLADRKDAEGNLLRKILPPRLVASGIYAFGEIAPFSLVGGKTINRFHNATMTICAL